MLEVALHPHSTSAEPAVTGLHVAIRRTQEGMLHLEYRLDAALDRIRTAAFSHPRRADHLWEHTCFELFLRVCGSAPYCELNFATSGAWAAYRFMDYRVGMQPVVPLTPQLRTRREANAVWLQAAVPLVDLDPSYVRAELQLAPSAVLENSAGQRTYWAAHHAAAKPDFHCADAFTVALPGV